MTLREPLQCHYGTSVPWYQFYKVKSPNKKLRTNGHGIDVFLWHNVWYILTTTQKIGELKRLFQRVFSPFHLRIVRFLDIVLQLIFATGRWSSSIFSSIYFCCSPTFLLFDYKSNSSIGKMRGNPNPVTFWWIVRCSQQRGRFYRLGQLWLLLFSLVLEELELWPLVMAYLHLSTNRMQNINNVKFILKKNIDYCRKD